MGFDAKRKLPELDPKTDSLQMTWISRRNG